MSEAPHPKGTPRVPLVHVLLLAGLAGAAVVIGCKSSPPPTAQSLLALGLQRTESAIDGVVEDPVRREEALRIVAAFGAREEELLEKTAEIRERLAALNAEHGTTRSAMQVELDALAENRARFSEVILDSWLDLAAVLEPEERQALIDLQLEEEDAWRAMLD